MVKARLRPRIAPIFPPVIISDAITSVYSVIAVWMPVTVVPTSLATVAMDTFITELSSVIRNWPAASVIRTIAAALRSTGVVTTSEGPGSRRGFAVHEVGAEVGGQQVLRSRVAAHLDHSSHETGPARLVAGPEP